LAQKIAIELIRAGTDRLDELQPRRGLQKLVAPEARNDQDIRFRQTPRQFIAGLNLETLDAEVSSRKLVVKLVRRMGAADHELILSTEHVGTLVDREETKAMAERRRELRR
jgi:hypothetical protein